MQGVEHSNHCKRPLAFLSRSKHRSGNTMLPQYVPTRQDQYAVLVYSLVHSDVRKTLSTAAHACRVGWTTLCMLGWVLRGAYPAVCGTASLQRSPTRRWPSCAARYGETLSSESGGLLSWEWGQPSLCVCALH